MNNTSQETIGKIPPQAPEIEMAVLGAMMLDRDAVDKVTGLLDGKAFYKDAHNKIFYAITTLTEKSEPVDIITVTEELKRKNQLEKIGGSYYLTECTNKVTSSANVEYYARLIMEKSVMRQMISVGTSIVESAYEDSEEPYSLLDRAEESIFQISENRLRQGFTDINDIIHKTMEVIESYHERKGAVTGIPTGFTRLDELTSGFQKSDLVIIAGRPSMGKTSLALGIARNVAVEYGKNSFLSEYCT